MERTICAPDTMDKSVAACCAVRFVLQTIRRAALSFGLGPRARCAFANQPKDDHMHASLAYVNGAGSADEDLRLLNTLLATGSKPPPPGTGKGKAVETGKSKDERQAEEGRTG